MSELNIRMGPALKYDTVDLNTYVWHGFAMIVTADETSDYSTTPTMRLTWKPYSKGSNNELHQSNGEANGVLNDEGAIVKETAAQTSKAIKLWTFKGEHGSFTFWRFKLEVPLTDSEQKVTYSLEGAAHPDSAPPAVKEGKSNSFFVPSKTQNFRWIGHSCNGFSASLDPKEWNGPDPLWNDALRQHEVQPYHAVVGGGDQIYNDKLVGEPEMKEWKECKDPVERMKMQVTPEIATAVERYLFNHYCEWYGSGAWSKTIAAIPMMSMLDDHDLIDGFGSYPDDLMNAPVFNHIGRRGFFYYHLFQQFQHSDVDGLELEKHSNKSIIFGGMGPYVDFPSQSYLAYFGPDQWILMIDCRAERKLTQICTRLSYDRIFDRVRKDLPAGVKHLVILLGVPLAYPRMVFMEKALSSAWNPIIMLAKGLAPGFANEFNGEVELLDDLNDHWCAANHKKERNQLVCDVQKLALEKSVRISWISGDVHAGGVGMFHGYHAHDPAYDPKMSLAIITSAIVNSPPPPAIISLLNKLGKKKHRSLFYAGTKETMVPLFPEGLNGQKQNDKYIVGARNWCSVSMIPESGDLEFELRVEKEKGSGEVKSYPVRTPAPKWNVPKEKHHLLLSKEFSKETSKLSGGKFFGKQSNDPVMQAAAV